MLAPHSRRETAFAVLLCAAGVASTLLPEFAQSRLRQIVRDAGRPGQVGVAWLADRAMERVHAAAEWILARPVQGDPVASDDAIAEFEALERRARLLEIESARLQERLAEVRLVGAPRYQGEVGGPLVVSDLLNAAVLGRENAERVRSGILLDAGASDGVAESSLVLDDSRPLVDQGVDGQVAIGQSVLAGRCVAGRIAGVGRRVSTVMPLTDPDFRGMAQILRKSDHGAVFAAEGLLEGRGDALCRLTFVAATEAVVVGDEVYTGGRDANTPEPMLYGRIVRAELPDGASHWDVFVEPAANLTSLRHVQIVRTKLNPSRLLAE